MALRERPLIHCLPKLLRENGDEMFDATLKVGDNEFKVCWGFNFNNISYF